jgi:hypothetical protein
VAKAQRKRTKEKDLERSHSAPNPILMRICEPKTPGKRNQSSVCGEEQVLVYFLKKKKKKK